MSDHRTSVSAVANLVIAGVALLSLSGVAVHYVAAQTGDVRVQATKLEGIAAQIPGLYDAIRTNREGIAALTTSVQRNAEGIEALTTSVQSNAAGIAALTTVVQGNAAGITATRTEVDALKQYLSSPEYFELMRKAIKD